ncbi:MAG: sodium:proton antiporter [Phycisphaerales bacterium]
MNEDLMFGLSAVLALGIGAQWLAWRLKLPAILVLLAFGFLVGPVPEAIYGKPWLNPSVLFGEMLFPFISLSVSVILFEGGMTLKLGELRKIGGAVRNFVSIGIGVTWLLITIAAHFLLKFDMPMSLLIGAIFTVTGPTVIGPLLRHVRPGGQLGPVLKWEGILSDPIGALLAVLVFESILPGTHSDVTPTFISALLAGAQALGAGLIVGLAGAGLLVLMFNRFWVPDYLQSPVTLGLVLAAFQASNMVHAESGLIAVTLMGAILANQRFAAVRHVIEFKENLRVLLISTLFILLAARLGVEDVKRIDSGGFAFMLTVILIVRPASVFLSTVKTGMPWKERLWLGLVAPRGIVAAAVASIFAFRLIASDYPGARDLVPVTFLVIVGTITFSGLIAGPAARALGLAKLDPQGVLIVGAHEWARKIASALKDEGLAVMMIDTNRRNINLAKMAGLNAHLGSVLSDELLEGIDMTETHRALAMTPNDEANALAAVHLTETFSRQEVYQLAPDRMGVMEEKSAKSHDLHGRYLFGDNITFAELTARFGMDGVLKTSKITETYTYEKFREHYGEEVLPMFIISETGGLTVVTDATKIDPHPGQHLISLVKNGTETKQTNGA